MDFSLILFIALLVTGGIMLLYRLFSRSSPEDGGSPQQVRQPLLVEYARALFPVVLIVFVLRSFVVEPFRIPSGSMLPNLYIGDFILVNKFKYGIRLPVINTRVVPVSQPRRGDVMVFRFPLDPKINYVKRVIGLPGDRLSYVDKKLSINGVAVDIAADGEFISPQLQPGALRVDQFVEKIAHEDHLVLHNPRRRSMPLTEVRVPEGHYFVMGDNRDHSSDSRSWRFVPESNIVGKAFFIWFSWKQKTGGGVNWSRIGQTIQ